jgi:hypothetical protein
MTAFLLPDTQKASKASDGTTYIFHGFPQSLVLYCMDCAHMAQKLPSGIYGPHPPTRTHQITSSPLILTDTPTTTLTHTAIVHFDLPFGLEFVDWDKLPASRELIMGTLKSFAAINSGTNWIAICNCAYDQTAVVKQCMLDLNFTEITPIFWHKPGHNQAGNPAVFVQAVEVMMFGYKAGPGGNTHPGRHVDKNPTKRHNFMSMKGVHSTARKTFEGKAVNVYEKPEGIGQWFANRYLTPGDTVIVCGAGAGGDVRGYLNAGMNVIAIENDPLQCKFLDSFFQTWTPTAPTDDKDEKEGDQSGAGGDSAGAASAEGAPESCPCCGCTLSETRLSRVCSQCNSAMCDACSKPVDPANDAAGLQCLGVCDAEALAAFQKIQQKPAKPSQPSPVLAKTAPNSPEEVIAPPAKKAKKSSTTTSSSSK